MKSLNKLSVRDKKIFDKYLRLSEHELSVYAFENIVVWKDLFDIRWRIIDDSLCIFFIDKICCFVYTSPLAKELKKNVITELFRIMDESNCNKNFSRIDNVEEKEKEFYLKLGYDCKLHSGDYLCLRKDLEELRGNKFKSKRASLNYFIKHYDYSFKDFSLRDARACLKLYRLWMEQRKSFCIDQSYAMMLEDSSTAVKTMFKNYRKLNLVGKIVKVGPEIKAFSFGYPLNKNTFCILYEITDLSIKGLAQLIFQRFCSELKSYKYINIMDDSGLANLKKTKMSYKPINIIPAYSIKRK